MKEILLGNDAIALALVHASVDMVSGYPGTPSSEILGSFQKYKHKYNLSAYSEWATNEKVGFEVAYAGAIAGKFTCATMKQVGLNVASDALMSASYIGLKGAMLLISADDPGFYSSQTEQDSRSFAKFAKIPVLDPSTPQEAYDFVKKGIEISHKFETITMLRPVMRVSHARQIIEVGELEFSPKKGNFERNIPRFAAVPPAGRFKQGIEQFERLEIIKQYNYDEFIKPKLKELKGAKVLCLTSGVADGYVKECISDQNLNIDVLKLDMPYPLPKKLIEKIFEDYEKVIVFEEPYPCIEEQLSSPKLHGKLTDDVHKIGEFTKQKALDTFIKLGVVKQKNTYENAPYENTLVNRPPNLCPGCPHRDVFFAMMKVFKKRKSIYTSDIGCYTLGLNQGAIDTVLCMGASVSMASGFYIANPEKTVVATIGDSTFCHSGVAPLINAVYQKHKFVLLILDNSTTAMTGRQVTPQRANPGDIDLKTIVQGCGIKCHEYTYTQDMDKTLEFMKSLKAEYEKNEYPTVAVIREFCVLDKDRASEHLPTAKVEVNEEKCIACDTCVTSYKCPPMYYNDKNKVQIDPFLCIGCTACVDELCPTDAFEEVEV